MTLLPLLPHYSHLIIIPPVRSCPGVFQWLSRRGMNINQFSKLVEGRVPPHTPDMLDHKVTMRKCVVCILKVTITGFLLGSSPG